ncbi:hypothetical protein JAAARDRAFT_60231 [Jaapia argillacea MUCL 33604]|uniref:Uncharacterized protein n=1 Tax=Jaapia argillacea MUCL 33604 TaxID=933084 RepID=A0A067PIN1_9AGAM|nr:hypothetical protein JAAARDRAFT_60231 [Jaapia argillacea MUCL 33604]
MQLSFNPPLGKTTTIVLPPQGSEADDEVKLSFTATFEVVEEYARAKQDGVRVEMWTDLPMKGRDVGEWGAIAFKDVSTDQVHEVGEAHPTLSLFISETEEQRAPETLPTLRVDISTHLHGKTHFSFTYRLIYPSGWSRWLGDFGHNGILAVERRDPRFNLWHDWRTPKEGVHVWETREPCLDDVEVGELGGGLGWSFWALGEDRRLHQYSMTYPPTKSTTIFALPRAAVNSITSYQLIVLLASQGASITVTSFGAIRFSSPAAGSVTLRGLEGSADPRRFVEDVLGSMSDPSCRLVDTDTSAGYAVLASPESTLPTSFSVIPLALNPTSRVSISISSLLEFSPVSTGKLCLFCPASDEHHIIAPSEDSSTQSLVIQTSPDGGQFVIAPLITLDAGTNTCEISIVTPYSPLAAEPEAAHRLPTPPPSPPPVHRTVQFRPIPAPIIAPQPRRAAVPQAIRADDQTKGRPGREADRSPPRSSSTVKKTTSESDAHVLAMRRYALLLLKVTMWFFKMMFMQVFGSRKGKKGDKSPTKTTRASPEPTRTPVVDEPPAPAPAEPEPSTEELPPPPENIPSSPEDHSDPPSPQVFPAKNSQTWVDVASKSIALIVKPSGPAASVDHLCFALNKAPKQPSVKSLVDGVFLVRLSGDAECGRLMVSVNN